MEKLPHGEIVLERAIRWADRDGNLTNTITDLRYLGSYDYISDTRIIVPGELLAHLWPRLLLLTRRERLTPHLDSAQSARQGFAGYVRPSR